MYPAGAVAFPRSIRHTRPGLDVTGLVLRIDAKVCHVEVEGRTLQVPLRGKLFEEQGWEKRPVAVGDRVRLTTTSDGGVIEEVLPRTSKLARRTGDGGREQVLAANMTLILIVSSIREPPFQAGLVDRILASAERQELPAALVLTKMDRDRKGEASHVIALYGGLGYRVLPTSIAKGHETRAELDAIGEMLHENVTVLSGLSGVGKSSLLNHLMPGLDLRIGSMSRIQQGKHTTTHTQLIPLPNGGHVLDTPGIRSFGLFGVDPQELSFYFREFAPLISRCEYRNCTHLVETDCAVREALGRGEIDAGRHDSYRRMFEELSKAEE